MHHGRWYPSDEDCPLTEEVETHCNSISHLALCEMTVILHGMLPPFTYSCFIVGLMEENDMKELVHGRCVGTQHSHVIAVTMHHLWAQSCNCRVVVTSKLVCSTEERVAHNLSRLGSSVAAGECSNLELLLQYHLVALPAEALQCAQALPSACTHTHTCRL